MVIIIITNCLVNKYLLCQAETKNREDFGLQAMQNSPIIPSHIAVDILVIQVFLGQTFHYFG